MGWEGLIARLAAGDDALGEAADLGSTTAALHRQLASALGTRLGDRQDVDADRNAAAAAIADAGFVELETAIDERLAKLDRLAGARLQRIHGDLHVGQILRAVDLASLLLSLEMAKELREACLRVALAA